MRTHLPDSALLELFELVGDLARRRHRLADQLFAKLDLTHTEARLLSLLQGKEGAAPQDELSQMVTIDRSNVGRSLLKLEQQGYVTRCQQDSDKRAKLVALTDKGRRAVREIKKLRKEMAMAFFGDLSEERAREIVAELRRAVAQDSGTSVGVASA